MRLRLDGEEGLPSHWHLYGAEAVMDGSRITIGQLAFLYAEYDAFGDVLYLHNNPWGFPIERDHETAEGHMISVPWEDDGSKVEEDEEEANGRQDGDEDRCDEELEIIALALIEPRQRARREGRLLITLPATSTPRIIELSEAKVELIIASAEPVPPPEGYEEGDEDDE